MSNVLSSSASWPAQAFLDTNIIIRLLTGDDPVKQQAARSLFEAARNGSVTLSLIEAVIAEAVYVLSSARLYNVPRGQVAAMLIGLCIIPNVEVRNKAEVLAALTLYGASNLDFEDALIVAVMQNDGVQVVYSYDTHFDRVADILRQEP